MKTTIRALGWIAVALALLIPPGAGSAPLTLTGQISTAGTSFTIGQLQALGNTSETVNGNQFVGVSLWSLLGGTSSGASNVVTSGGGNNPILRNYIVATGSDGASSLLSVGEIDPLFGGTGQPDLVAYQENGALLTTPILVVPQDPTGTRDVSILVSLSVLGVARPPVGPGGTTTQFDLTGVTKPATYDLGALQALPVTTDFGVTFFSGANQNGPHDYTGVAIWTLLSDAGIGDILHSYFLATGSDGYEVLFSLGELDPAFGAPSDLIAYGVDGASLGSAGFARTVLPGDLRGGRYVSNLASLQVATVDEPPVLAMTGLLVAGMLALRRRRVAA